MEQTQVAPWRWDDTQEKWYFSVVDVIQVLTENDYQTARKYWNKLKERILAEAGQPVTICHQFKLRAADGKMRMSDVADQEQLFRIIQSVPSSAERQPRDNREKSVSK